MNFTEYRYWNTFYKLEKLVLEKHLIRRRNKHFTELLSNATSIPVWRLYRASLEIFLKILMDYFLLYKYYT